MGAAITIHDIRAAAARIGPHVHHTPLWSCRSLDLVGGGRLLLKAENLQRGGAFKVRGACNTILQLPDEALRRGVITHSSGNHAQGVALAAGLSGIRAVVVMPAWANPAKVAAARAYGAEVVTEGVTGDNREEVAERIRRERGLTLIHPYDDERIIAGQGTVGLEIAQDAPAELGAVFVPVGGGGLISGVATALKALRPAVRVIGVETEGADDAARSLRTGVLQRLPATPSTVADGIRTLSLGARNWDIVRRLVDDIIVVSDAAVMAALELVLTRAKLVLEPTGAVAVAGALAAASSRQAAPGTVVAVASGGNLDVRPLFDPAGRP